MVIAYVIRLLLGFYGCKALDSDNQPIYPITICFLPYFRNENKRWTLRKDEEYWTHLKDIISLCRSKSKEKIEIKKATNIEKLVFQLKWMKKINQNSLLHLNSKQRKEGYFIFIYLISSHLLPSLC